jgi:hypothetical protein
MRRFFALSGWLMVSLCFIAPRTHAAVPDTSSPADSNRTAVALFLGALTNSEALASPAGLSALQTPTFDWSVPLVVRFPQGRAEDVFKALSAITGKKFEVPEPIQRRYKSSLHLQGITLDQALLRIGTLFNLVYEFKAPDVLIVRSNPSAKNAASSGPRDGSSDREGEMETIVIQAEPAQIK